MSPQRVIGGRLLNSGIRGGLWEEKHRKKMRDAVWLFCWLVHRQTIQRNGIGLVLRGKPITYADMTADTGWPERTLQRWMARLQREGYIEVSHSTYSRMVIRIKNAKKFNPKQLEFPGLAPAPSPPKVADITPPDMAHIAAKNGGLKERAEFERKLLRSSPAVWNFLGVDGSRFAPPIQEQCASLYQSRNGQTPAELIGLCMDGIAAMGGSIPPQIAQRAKELRSEFKARKQERTQELEELPWVRK